MQQTSVLIGDITVEREKKKRGRKPGVKTNALTADEVQLIINGPKQSSNQGKRDYAILLAFGNTPMRKGELVALNTDSLVNDGGKFYIVRKVLKKKGDHPVWDGTPISGEVYAGIKSYIDRDPQRTPSSPLFRTLGKHGPYQAGRITPKAIDCVVQKYIKKAGIARRITPHSFRKTYTTMRKHRDAWTLKNLGRWANISSVMPYVQDEEKEVEEAALEFQFA